MPTPIPVDLGRIAQDLQVRRVQVEAVVQLLDEGNTVPFITRYRKERTGNLNEVALREIQGRVLRLRELAERKETILKTIEAQGKLSDELAEAIRAAENPKRLEDLYLPYKPKKKNKASDAREKGLEPLALRIWNRDETLGDLPAAAAEFLDPAKGLETPESVLEGVGHILAEAVSEIAAIREGVRRVVWKAGKIMTTKGVVKEGEGLEYRDYFDYSEPVGMMPPHRVLAINRGDKEGALKVKLDVPRQELERATLGQLPLQGHPHADFFAHSAVDALDRLLFPSIEREVRRDLTEMAERHAVEVFARNLRSLLLQPPIAKQVVLAIDPGFRTGCKVAVMDEHGNLVDQGVIHPHAPQNKRSEAKLYLKDLVAKHKVGVVAIGNGTACRETEELVAQVIAEGTHFHNNPDAPLVEVPMEAPSEAAIEAQAQGESAEAPPQVTPGAEAPAEEVVNPPEVKHEAASHEPPTADAPPQADPGPSEVAAEAEAPAESTNGSAGEAEPVESMPPIIGGAPEEGEDTPKEPPAPAADPAPPSQDDPGQRSPIETVPPPSSTPEAEQSATEADRADVLEKPHAPETRNPTAEHVEPPAEPAETPPADAPPPAPGDKPAHAPLSGFALPPVGLPMRELRPNDPRRNAKPPKADQPPRPPKIKQPPMPPRPHPADPILANLSYVIVNEAGASVYSASTVGREEFPDFDATTRGTISIGRRLQDPLAELVKIEPQAIGVGLYQHDVNPRQLKDSLEGVIESCVNYVGVDLNSASAPLLGHVSGLNQLTARRVVEHRQAKGPFTSREQLKEVEGIGPITYTQAAGFLKITDAAHPFDRTWVHPESYEVATRLLEKFGLTPEVIARRDELPSLHAKLNEADLPALATELAVGEATLHDIFEALARPERDPREDLPKPIFKKGVLKLEDLAAGMELKGTVLNVVDFGAFVDIGLKDSGLVHISQLANRYIKSPHDVVSVGDVVTIWVMGVDGERKRVSLTMVQPGTERSRERAPGERGPGPGQGRGPRPPQGDLPPQGQGQGPGDRPPMGERRPAPPRPPRPEGGPGGGPGRGPAPAPQRGLRVPGPPQRAMGGGPGGRGGSRPGGMSGGPRKPAPPLAPTGPAVAPKPPKPDGPPPPLSKDALTGSVPLRSFGQLKQLYQARDEPGTEGQPQAEPPAEPPTS